MDHYPFRSWCEECVKGRGTGEPHRTAAGERTAIFSFDYVYLTKGLSGLEIVEREAVGKGDVEGAASSESPKELQKKCVKVLVAKDSRAAQSLHMSCLRKAWTQTATQ